MRSLRDPWARSVVLAAVLVGAGFVALGVAAVGASRALAIGEQVAFLVSGGMGGIAVAGTGLALLVIQRSRRTAAEEREELAVAAAHLGAIAEGIAARRLNPPRRRRRVLRAR